MSDQVVSESWFRLLVHHASDLIVVLGQDSLVKYANAASVEVFNLEPD